MKNGLQKAADFNTNEYRHARGNRRIKARGIEPEGQQWGGESRNRGADPTCQPLDQQPFLFVPPLKQQSLPY